MPSESWPAKKQYPEEVAIGYESMSFEQLRDDPVAGPVLEEMALQSLKRERGFKNTYESKLDEMGRLVSRAYPDAKRRKPSGSLVAGLKKVENMTKAELRKLRNKHNILKLS